MKFLCNNCKAKYQIADEKLAGRTLKMKCRKCGHDIIIRKDAESRSEPPAGKGPPPAPPPRAKAPSSPRAAGGAAHGSSASASVPAARRSGGALGADFRRQVAAPAAAEPEPPLLDQWHVAINDVPVGPVKRAELARKVASGAVHAGSLVWREGFDDWRPLEQVAELADLLREHAPGASGEAAASQRSASGAVAPVGGRLGASASPAVDSTPAPASQPAPGLLGQTEATRAPGSAPQPAPAPPAPPAEAERPRRGPAIPVGGWIAIAGAVAFGGVFAVVAADRLLGEGGGEAAAAEQAADAPPGDEDPGEGGDEERVQPDMVITEEDLAASGDEEEEEDDEAASAEDGEETRSGSRVARRRSGAGRSGSSDEKLTAEQRRTLDRFSGESGAAPDNIRTRDTSSGGGSGGSQGLSAAQLTKVVGKNRPQLGRCYETAIRGMSDPPSVRLDVDITVGVSGTVTRVRARGSNVGDLRSCIERSVRRWRFPSSGDQTRTSFPVVFQPGG